MIDLDRFKRWMGLRRLYLKATLPQAFPSILNLEPTNRCNLACTMCPHAQSRRPLSDLDFSLAESLADEMAHYGPVLKVFLQKDGEPLLYTRLDEIVALLRRKRSAREIAVITNGTLLSTDRFAELARAGLDTIIVSIDAVDPQEYKLLKGRDTFESVVTNVEKCCEAKKRLGLKTTLKARMVGRRGREDEIEQFRKYWKGKADAIDITPYHTWIGAVRDERTYARQARYPCSLLWYTGIINADGQVSPCCIDYDCRGVVGCVGSGGFSAVWNGREMNKLRRRHLLGQYAQTAICGPCEYWLIKEDLGSWLRRKYRIGEPDSDNILPNNSENVCGKETSA